MSPAPRRRRRLSALLLTHADLVPPAGARARAATRVQPPWATEHAVAEAIARRGHEVTFVGLDDELDPLDRAIDLLRPDVVVNLLEEFDDRARLVAHVVAYLEALGWPVTGCAAAGLFRTQDKALAKTLLRAAGVPVAPGFVVRRGRRPPARPPFPFPLVVKAVDEHGSAGLSDASIATTPAALARAVARLHGRLGTHALVEGYVEGRELYVTVLGGTRPRALPPHGVRHARRPRSPWLLTERLKWDPAERRARGLSFTGAVRLAPAVKARVARTATTAYAALGLTGPACVDLRLAPDGTPVVLEVNPNPDLHPESDTALAARAAGLPYGVFVESVLVEALARRGG